MRVVGATDLLGLVVEEALDAAGGLPVELDVRGLVVMMGMGKGGVERKEEDVSVRAEERVRDGEKKTTLKEKRTKNSPCRPSSSACTCARRTPPCACS